MRLALAVLELMGRLFGSVVVLGAVRSWAAEAWRF